MSGSTYVECARAILRDAGRPLTAREITNAAIERGLLRPMGKTPEATMTAALYTRATELPDLGIERVFEPGRQRARRGSVRWVWRGVLTSQLGEPLAPTPHALPDEVAAFYAGSDWPVDGPREPPQT